MKQITKPLAAYELPQNLLDIRSWTDIMMVIGLALETFFDWIFGGYILPRGIWS
ncbi:MAG: hypothetical protein GY851_14990 [bacterium]|nr:hypothetical protein [bacterium]